MMETRPLRKLNNSGTTEVVINDTLGMTCVCKRIPKEQVTVYERLMEHKPAHVPKVYGIDDLSEKSSAIYEEFIEGKSLDQCLSEGIHFTEKEIINIISVLTRTIRELAKYDIIHRDIKPSNIILDSNGQIYLVDFGIARSYKEGKSSDTVLLGTEGFAAPEQYGFGQSDTRTDIYAIGVLANYLLTGCFPAKKIYKGALGEVIRKATNMNPDSRYQTPEELLAAIKVIVAQITKKRVLVAITAFAGALIICGIVFLAVKLSRDNREPNNLLSSETEQETTTRKNWVKPTEATTPEPTWAPEIEVFAHKDDETIVHYEMASDIRYVQMYAFSGCKNLKQIDFSDGLYSIGRYAFEGCVSLEEVILPEKLRKIEPNAFSGCTNLKYITIPAYTTDLGENIFDENSSVIIRCEKDSKAQEYAIKYNLQYEIIGE